MTVRIGANPIAWSNDDLRELGGATPLETCLAEARDAGFVGMELGHKFPREPKALEQVLASHGHELVSGWYSSQLLLRDHEAELTALRPHLDLLKALGARVLIFAETSNAIHGDRSKPLSQRPRMTEDQWPVFTERLTRVAEAVADEGLDLVYHHHMGTIIENAHEIDRLMEETGAAVKLLLDAGHATFGGGDPVALAQRHRERIRHVHCKDIRKDVMLRSLKADRSFLDAVLDGVFTVPGDGCVDFVGILTALKGYSGWLVVEAEQDPEKAHPLTYARMGYRNLEGYARTAGLL